MDKPWKVVFAFVAVFIAGAVFGGLFTLRAAGKRLADWRKPERPAVALPNAPATTPAASAKSTAATPNSQPAKAAIMPALMRQFTQRLKLSTDQKERVRPIVGRAGEDFARLRQENLADTARVTERMYADVSAVLTVEQRAELEKMRQQMQERVQAERHKRAEAAAAEGPNRPGANAPTARPVSPKTGAP